MTGDRHTVRARIRGRVQGVGYRDWTERTARAHGLDGWVRNLPDGSVEALFSGPRATVERMLADCRNGPPAARVASVETEDVSEGPPAGNGFRARYT